MRVAVVGHVEWAEFLRVERVPSQGEIVYALERWEEPAGGGGVAAVQLAALAGNVTLYTAFGGDALGRRARTELERRGVHVHAGTRPEPQRRALVYIDESGERTITVIGPRHAPRLADPLPWEELAETNAVYFTAGGVEVLQQARRARVLVATSRERRTLVDAGLAIDAVVGSGEDDAEQVGPADLDPEPQVVVTTAGALGGWLRPGGPFRAVKLPGPLEDSYGAGDSFAAGLTYGLGRGWSVDEAVAAAAACGAEALTRRGAHGLPD